MASQVQPERIHVHKDHVPVDGNYVLYWMQASARTRHNPALEYAIESANELGLPLLVCFVVTDNYPEASLRHYRFLLEGLCDVAHGLAERRIGFVVKHGDPAEVAISLAEDAASLVIDRGYLRPHRRWRRDVVRAVDLPIVEVEGDVVVPVETVSDKREFAARTIRPRIHRHLDRFLVPLHPSPVASDGRSLGRGGLDVCNVDRVLDGLDIDRSVAAVSHHQGGERNATAALDEFLGKSFSTYDEHRNQPQTDSVSYMSMYLHYGHISPVFVALCATRAGAARQDLDSFVEELIVRRELAFNYAWFEPRYDSYSALPEWARNTLQDHRDDVRDFVYTRSELEAAATHDPYWNACMVEMRETGYMHNYMRMYWGKKILEWTNTPEYAYRTCLYLNNKYLLDGRDPNSYTGVGWVFGLHDRPWTEREVFGKTRYMNAAGLRRKADPDCYVAKVEDRTGLTIAGKGDDGAQTTLQV